MHIKNYVLVVLIALISFGCQANDSADDYLHRQINIGNFTGQTIIVEFPTGIDEPFWDWQTAEIAYSSVEILDGSIQRIAPAIFDNKNDKLRIILIDAGTEFIVPEMWRECIQIGIYFDPYLGQLSYDISMY